MHTKNSIVLLISLVMGCLAALLARNWLQSHASASSVDDIGGTVVVAASSLTFGSEIAADNILEIPWIAKSIPEGAFGRKDELLKDGRRVVLSPLERGEPILRSKITGPGQRALLSSLLDAGMRAVTVRVDDVRGVAGFILPGDFVDVVLIAEDAPPRRENYSEILLQHVKVLAVDQLASEKQEQPTIAKAVTVEVTPDQAQKVLLATNIGKLSLILRRPEEQNLSQQPRVTERDLGRNGAVLVTTGVGVRPVPETPPKPAVAPPPPPAPTTVNVTVVRNNKREEYAVKRAAKP